jgi:hypothetical protein
VVEFGVERLGEAGEGEADGQQIGAEHRAKVYRAGWEARENVELET